MVAGVVAGVVAGAVAGVVAGAVSGVVAGVVAGPVFAIIALFILTGSIVSYIGCPLLFIALPSLSNLIAIILYVSSLPGARRDGSDGVFSIPIITVFCSYDITTAKTVLLNSIV